MAFTDKQIKGLKAKESPYRIFEKGPDKGFGIQVTANGAVSFFVQYAINSKKRFYNLGRYPSVTLYDARIRCREARMMIDNGQDPQEQKTPHRFGLMRDLFDYYIKKMRDDGKSTWEAVQNDINANCQSIMTMQANMVEPVHIRKILHTIINRGSEVQANRIRAYLHRAFKLGVYHDNDPVNLSSSVIFQLSMNPVEAIPKNTKAEAAGERNLSFAEIRTLWNSGDIGEQMHNAAKLLLIYGCRMMELCGANKNEFDFEAMIWTIPWERVKTSKKNKRPHLLPITPMAKTLLDRQFIYAWDSDYLFPGRHDNSKHIHQTSLNHALRRVSGIAVFDVRALRRTWKTRTGEVGIGIEVRNLIQNHSRTDVSSVHYDKWSYLVEKREALEKWECHLQGYMQVENNDHRLNHTTLR
jgi:integrase